MGGWTAGLSAWPEDPHLGLTSACCSEETNSFGLVSGSAQKKAWPKTAAVDVSKRRGSRIWAASRVLLVNQTVGSAVVNAKKPEIVPDSPLKHVFKSDPFDLSLPMITRSNR